MCPNPPSLKALYTITEAAELLGLTRHVVKGWVKRGVLATIVLDGEGGTRWIPLASISARALVWESVLLRLEMLGRMKSNDAGRCSLDSIDTTSMRGTSAALPSHQDRRTHVPMHKGSHSSIALHRGSAANAAPPRGRAK